MTNGRGHSSDVLLKASCGNYSALGKKKKQMLHMPSSHICKDPHLKSYISLSFYKATFTLLCITDIRNKFKQHSYYTDTLRKLQNKAQKNKQVNESIMKNRKSNWTHFLLWLHFQRRHSSWQTTHYYSKIGNPVKRKAWHDWVGFVRRACHIVSGRKSHPLTLKSFCSSLLNSYDSSLNTTIINDSSCC